MEDNILQVGQSKKDMAWQYMLSLPKSHRPHGCTENRLNRVRPFVMDNKDFWEDIVHRHGLVDLSPEELEQQDKEAYEHCEGNFWGQIMEIMWRNKIIK